MSLSENERISYVSTGKSYPCAARTVLPTLVWHHYDTGYLPGHSCRQSLCRTPWTKLGKYWRYGREASIYMVPLSSGASLSSFTCAHTNCQPLSILMEWAWDCCLVRRLDA